MRDPSGVGEPVASMSPWRCPSCMCSVFARVDERKADGSYGPGPQIRCVDCKGVFSHPDELSLADLEREARSLWNERQEGCAKHGAVIPMPTMAVPVDVLANALALVTSAERDRDEAVLQLAMLRLSRPTVDDLQRLSQTFNAHDGTWDSSGVRINEWLKANMADARGVSPALARGEQS